MWLSLLNFSVTVHNQYTLQAVIYGLNTGKFTVWPSPAQPILAWEFSTQPMGEPNWWSIDHVCVFYSCALSISAADWTRFSWSTSIVELLYCSSIDAIGFVAKCYRVRN